MQWFIKNSYFYLLLKIATSCLPKQAMFFLCFQGCLDTLWIPTLFPMTLSTLPLSVAQWPNTVPSLSLSLCPGISFLRSVIQIISALYYLYSFEILFQATEKIIFFLNPIILTILNRAWRLAYAYHLSHMFFETKGNAFKNFSFLSFHTV